MIASVKGADAGLEALVDILACYLAMVSTRTNHLSRKLGGLKEVNWYYNVPRPTRQILCHSFVAFETNVRPYADYALRYHCDVIYATCLAKECRWVNSNVR